MVEKSRGKGVNLIRNATYNPETQANSFLVQTNHDWGQSDPDARQDIAQFKIENAIKSESWLESVYEVLLEAPNFN